jgi:hypothetical protein
MKSFSFLLSSLESTLVFRKKPGLLDLEKITSFRPAASLSKYCVFADEAFNIGDAWYCVDDASGAVYRIDPEYGNAPELVNASLDAFTASIQAAADWSAENEAQAAKVNIKRVNALKRTLSKIDPTAFKSPDGHWTGLIDHMKTCVTDGDEEMEFKFEIK